MILNPVLPGRGGERSGFRVYETYGAFAPEIKKGKTGFISLYCMGEFHILFDFSIRTSLVNTVVTYNPSVEYTIVSGMQLDVLIIRRGQDPICTLMDLSGSVEPEVTAGFALRYATVD